MRYLRAHWDWILLLLAALLPRLWQLDRFITPDEILFLDHARQFLEGLASGDLSLTIGIGYPGVTLAWVNGLGLLTLFGLSQPGVGSQSLGQFLAGADIQPLPYYVAGRVATAMLVTALLLLFYALARHLFPWTGRSQSPGREHGDVALLSALLLSLDPFVMSYSRLMHIAAPLALLMLLAVMAWLLWLKESKKRWLWLAGLFSGLAISTKTTALLLPPLLLGLSPLVWLAEHSQTEQPSNRWTWLGRAFVGWLGTLGIATLVFYALWPAMWQDPGATLALTLDKLWVDKEAGQGNLGMFWMGRFVEDPGPAFYLVAMLLKLSPLMLIGLASSLVSLGTRRGRVADWGLWVYALLYLLVMTLATKKSVRYMLPAFAAFAPLAADGLLRLSRWVASSVPVWRKREGNDHESTGAFRRPPLLLGFGLLLLGFSLLYAPYYFSYYNPLLVGWRWAPRAILVGWGEGLGDAARYLNQRPGAAQTSVAAWYDWAFAPFFVGQTLPLSSENAMRADYTVFYINQVQRNIPDPNLISYFQRRRPEYVVRLNGVDYAWIYPAISSDGPAPPSAIPVSVPMGEMVSLEGYEMRSAPAGQGMVVTLYWRALQSDLSDYFVYVRAVDGAGQIHARADSPPVMGFWPTSRWQAGQLVTDAQVLLRPAESNPGTYRLEVGMYDPQTWTVLEPASGERGEGGGLLLGEVTLP